ncbi:CDP-diacylglycerol--glycerol-3-phosphate 3-phosphatidyltransferase [Thermosipho melanesiensis]|uniref:CDP-diacylglycerol--glycerol-3-phosphate 3-phosphatidyltransferase n=2 Tax=Thermosipho melanesiensis TaxID=46541 RepID=A6LM60_THEM4|nr:CDP-diacylglycerol--glycerol-3-phosphate 3-phosphatidyltransferase [Thermosipho melanesiensis]ABR31011.1 CDP-diacylglycerol--glycerol-3-phosphate 3-phosphatidyltransferase [Thermosipho melanesiensis BI429]APT74105.1 CDP-diacylglycerol--glycerol-3-phosphate 3-phosphatidyltransferase [Thermosipho melanesiensis]OOC36052.1 CDP-diacylglycerol--glycerol-3-phosphate 3-phosphatidyltransferase [Thermosipho melanesiensis]OOC36869.1 CDP-diacylglycerol--glycerol-3-phosphate 3-phosphatidyltransferase [Th
MNIPNTITWTRVFLAIIIVFLLLNGFNLLAFVLFIVSAISDYFDGYFARKLNQITNFGKIFDQMSDKILITSVLIVFVELGFVPSWMVVIIFFRDALVTTIRMVALVSNEVIAANYFGKLKTVTQMFWVVFLFMETLGFKVYMINLLLSYVVITVTVFSGVIYLVQNKRVLKG